MCSWYRLQNTQFFYTIDIVGCYKQQLASRLIALISCIKHSNKLTLTYSPCFLITFLTTSSQFKEIVFLQTQKAISIQINCFKYIQ